MPRINHVSAANHWSGRAGSDVLRLWKIESLLRKPRASSSDDMVLVQLTFCASVLIAVQEMTYRPKPGSTSLMLPNGCWTTRTNRKSRSDRQRAGSVALCQASSAASAISNTKAAEL